MFKSTIILFLYVLFLVHEICAKTTAVNLDPTNREASIEISNCNSANPISKTVCTKLVNKVNSELERVVIQLDRNGLLFNYNDPRHQGIPTGHSCSVTAQIRHKHASARIHKSAKINLSGNSLSETLVVASQLPVSFNVRIDVRQRFGARIFGKCRRYGRDSYALKGSLSTLADIAIGFRLNPSISKTSSGDYALTLMPTAALLFDLRNSDVELRPSGVSPIGSIWTAVIGSKSTILKSITHVFQGRSLKTIWNQLKKGLAFDFGAPVALNIRALPRSVRALLFKRLARYGERKAEKLALRYGRDLEDELNEKIRSALKTDKNGKRVIVVKKNFAEIVGKLGEAADIFV